MALSRVTTWSSGAVLTASALNAEFDNILNNAVSLFSPLTANLNANGFSVTNLGSGSISAPGLAFNNDSNTGITGSADVLELVTGGLRALQIASASSAVNWLRATPSATAVWPTFSVAGADTDIGLRLETQGTGYVGAKRGRSIGENFWPSFGFYDEHGRAEVAGIMQISAGTLDLVAGGRRVLQASAYVNATNFLRITPSQSGQPVVVGVGGGDTNADLRLEALGSGVVRVATALVPASLGGGPALGNTPAQHGLYRENVVKAYINFKGTSTASIYGSFNIASLARTNTGEYTITWDRDFAATPYVIAGTGTPSATNNGVLVLIPEAGVINTAVGSIDIQTRDVAGTHVDPQVVNLIAIGGQ